MQGREAPHRQHDDVLWRAHRRLPYRGPSPFRPLLFSVFLGRVVNIDGVCVDMGRDARPAVRVGRAQQDGAEAAHPDPDPDAGAGEALNVARVQSDVGEEGLTPEARKMATPIERAPFMHLEFEKVYERAVRTGLVFS